MLSFLELLREVKSKGVVAHILSFQDLLRDCADLLLKMLTKQPGIAGNLKVL